MAEDWSPQDAPPLRAGAEEGLRVARNSAYLSIGAVSSLALGFVSTILITDTLGDDYGIFVAAQRFVGFFLVLASFGLHPLLVRRLAAREGDAGEIFATVIVLRLLLGCVFALLVPGAAVAAGYLPDARWVLLGFVAIEFVGIFADTCVALCEGFEHMARVAVVPLARSVIVFAGVIAVAQAGGGIREMLAVYLLSQLVRLVVALGLARPIARGLELRVQRARMLPLMAEASWFVAIGVSSTALGSLAVLGLARLSDAAETARYAAALNFVQLVMMAPLLAQRALLPAFSRLQGSGDAAGLAEGGLRLLPSLMIPAAVGLVVLSDGVMSLYPSGQFADAAPVLRVLALGLLFLGPSFVAASFLTGIGRLRTLVAVNILATIAGAIVLLVLVPRLGAPGAAWAAVASFAVTGGVQLLLIRTEGVGVPWAPLLRVAAASAGMGALVFPLRDLALPVGCVVGLLSYGLLLWAITPRESPERRLLDTLVARWRSR